MDHDGVRLSPEAPACPFFGTCGGCQYQHLAYEEELVLKERVLKDLLGATLAIEDHVFSSIVASPKIYHYRNRLDLKLIHRRNGDVHIGFSSAQRGPLIEVGACPIAMEQVSDFIPRLRAEAAACIPKDYRMANLTVRCGDGPNVRWGGIGHNSLRLDARDYFFTDISGRRIYYALDAFFQANLSILPNLVGFLRARPMWGGDTVFFDLYGGVGFFGLCLSDLVARVLNIEENVHAIRLAKYNAVANAVDNIEIIEGRMEDVLPDLAARALPGAHVIMVDPPRAGLSDSAIAVLNNVMQAHYLVYLSCDPGSLADNLKDLVAGGWGIDLIKPFDLFPRTRHLETLVILKRS